MSRVSRGRVRRTRTDMIFACSDRLTVPVGKVLCLGVLPMDGMCATYTMDSSLGVLFRMGVHVFQIRVMVMNKRVWSCNCENLDIGC